MKTSKIFKRRDSKRQSPLSSGERPGVKLSWIIALFLLMPFATFAQTADNTFWNDPFNSPLLPLFTVTGLVFITIILVMVVAVRMLTILNLIIRKEAEEKALREGRTFVAPPTFWDRFWNDVNASVPLEKENTIELDHNYDGIKELDNHLPPWWKGLLYLTIIWGIGYMIVYHVSFSLPLSAEEYNKQMAEADAAKRAFLASQPAAVVDENALVFDPKSEFIVNGKKVFTDNLCQQCHREDGGGNGIGPNLTDDYWIHGGSIKDIFLTIKNGVLEKGMPVWGKVMSPTDVRDVTFYVMSLHGSNPPNAKAAQGELYKPEEPTNKADTTITAAK